MALAAGARHGTAANATSSLTESYRNLNALVRTRLSGRPDGALVLARYESAPATWRDPLIAELIAAGVEGDRSILAAAEALMAMADPPGSRAGKYSMEISGSQGIQVGDGGSQHNIGTYIHNQVIRSADARRNGADEGTISFASGLSARQEFDQIDDLIGDLADEMAVIGKCGYSIAKLFERRWPAIARSSGRKKMQLSVEYANELNPIVTNLGKSGRSAAALMNRIDGLVPSLLSRLERDREAVTIIREDLGQLNDVMIHFRGRMSEIMIAAGEISETANYQYQEMPAAKSVMSVIPSEYQMFANAWNAFGGTWLDRLSQLVSSLLSLRLSQSRQDPYASRLPHLA
jgi:hypothetical protein